MIIKCRNVCINPAFLAAEHQSSGRTHSLSGTNQSKEGLFKTWLRPSSSACDFIQCYGVFFSDFQPACEWLSWEKSVAGRNANRPNQTVQFDRGMWSEDMLQVTFLFVFSLLLSVCPLQVNASLWFCLSSSVMWSIWLEEWLSQASSCSEVSKVWTSSDSYCWFTWSFACHGQKAEGSEEM